MLIFYLAAMIFNNDEKRIVTSIKKVIEEKSIINPQDITLTIKRLNNNGKPIVIKEKVALNPEHRQEIQLRVDKIQRNLQQEINEKEETKKTHSISRGP